MVMYHSPGLIPAKFLTLIAHLAICVTLIWNIQESVKLCLPESYETKVHLVLQNQLSIGLYTSIGLIAFELLAFLTGITMFNQTSAFTSVVCHSSACLYLSYLVFDGWQCGWFWTIFGACSALPALYDICTIADVFIKRKF